MPIQIADEIGELISELCAAGWKLTHALYDSKCFGNWYVDLYRADTAIRLVKDRSQYQMTGLPQKDLEAGGLWTVFEDPIEFCHKIREWAKNS